MDSSRRRKSGICCWPFSFSSSSPTRRDERPRRQQNPLGHRAARQRAADGNALEKGSGYSEHESEYDTASTGGEVVHRRYYSHGAEEDGETSDTSSAVSNSSSSYQDSESVESDPQQRALRAAESFRQWSNKEYVPLTSEEKRALKEHRRSMASEEGTYMNSRAQRPNPGETPKETEEFVDLNDPDEHHALARRRSQIRFTEAVIADVVVAVPLQRTGSILSNAMEEQVVDEIPVFEGV